MSRNSLFVLGTSDPEMQVIETLLRAAGQRVAFAMCGGKRVHPGVAYKADAISEEFRDAQAVTWVECAPGDGTVLTAGVAEMAEAGVVFSVVDHHREGDPGFGKGPREFLEASSVGQIVGILAKVAGVPGWIQEPSPRFKETDKQPGRGGFFLDKRRVEVCSSRPWEVSEPMYRLVWVVEGAALSQAARNQGYRYMEAHWQVPDEVLFAAAADHCLAHAYRGECPGVKPDKLMTWRAASRAAFQKRSVEEVLSDVERARAALRAAPEERLGLRPEPCGCMGGCEACNHEGIRGGSPVYVRDLRGKDIPELPEAAAREGLCFLSEVKDRDGRIKVVCQAGSDEEVRCFMRQWALRKSLDGIYGDPARGFAGGYKK